MSITWAVTVKDELEEVSKLLNFLQEHVDINDEILVQYDDGNSTIEVESYLKILDKLDNRVKVVGFPLNGDFASFKNNLTKHSTKDYIVQIDADEIPHQNFVEQIGNLLNTNTVDLIFIPRINTVEGITLSDIRSYGWNITKIESESLVDKKEIDEESDEYELLKHYDLIIGEENGIVEYYRPVNNFPDYQTRVYKRTEDILWMNKVHERITGYNNFSNLPAKEEWSFYHHKKIDKQRKQNEFYNTL